MSQFRKAISYIVTKAPEEPIELRAELYELAASLTPEEDEAAELRRAARAVRKLAEAQLNLALRFSKMDPTRDGQ